MTQPYANMYLIATFHSPTADFIRHNYGHVTLTMSLWLKYGHRSLVGCNNNNNNHNNNKTKLSEVKYIIPKAKKAW